MELYVTGVVVVAVFGLLELVTILADTFSIKFKNYNNVGLYFDPITEKFYAHRPSWIVWFFLVVNLILITPVFSWLSIGLLIINIIKKYVAKSHLPNKIKEIEYTLSTFRLSKDKAAQLINELSLFYYGLKDSNLCAPSMCNNRHT